MIDNIYTNLKPNIGLISGILEVDIVDHLPVFLFSYTTKDKKQKEAKTVTFRKLNNKAYSNIRRKLNSIEWTKLNNMSFEEGYSTFINTLKDDVNSTSQKCIRHHKIIREPWITKGIMKSSCTLDKLYKKKLTHPPGHATHLKYKEYRNKFNTLKRICKQLYYGEILNEYKNNLKDV